MIVCSVASVGLVAGIVAVPAGVYLHHLVLPTMAHAANSGYPPSLITVFAAGELVLLALAGLAIAVVGALVPAGRSAAAPPSRSARSESDLASGASSTQGAIDPHPHQC